jgi:hypothetical protein
LSWVPCFGNTYPYPGTFTLDIITPLSLVLCGYVEKQGITNMQALPVDKMLYIYLLCPHSEHQKQIHSNLNSLNTFTKKMGSSNMKTDSNKLKLPKVGSNVIVPVPGPKNQLSSQCMFKCLSQPMPWCTREGKTRN